MVADTHVVVRQAGPTAELGGSVVLVSLSLSALEVSPGWTRSATISQQLYTFGVLKPGGSVTVRHSLFSCQDLLVQFDG